MNIRDLQDRDHDGQEPPTADLLAAEYVLGVLDADQRRDAQARIARDAGFARLVSEWERRLAPLLAEYAGADVPAHVWLRIRQELGWPAVEGARATAPKPGLWQSAGFWRAAAGLAAIAAIAALVLGPLSPTQQQTTPPDQVAVEPPPVKPAVEPLVEDPSAPKPVTPLLRDDGSPGWLASVDPKAGTVLMVPVPAAADGAGREPELWLIPPGESPKSLGIVSINRSHTVAVPEALREGLTRGAVLAITLEPKGGAPQGVATGPIIAKGDIAML
jgi:anti-sigma-K factor RskA